MRRKTFAGSVVAVALVAAALSSVALLSHEDNGTYTPDEPWSTPYFDHYNTVQDAREAGYVKAEPTCVPGMGFHYVKPEEMEAWSAGEQGGAQILLYDRDGFLVGVEYAFTAPSLDAPPIPGVEGPMEGHTEAMPIHYEQHIYFSKPQC
ncbi:MAG: hypothetical protein ABEL51_06155 [Salinibacter sp.]